MKYNKNQDSEIRQRVRTRYKNEMAELQSLGFDELAICNESMFPLSLVLTFPLCLLMLTKGEVITSAPTLRLTLCYPIMFNSSLSTFAMSFGMGTKFYTGFEDGKALLVSGNTGSGLVRVNQPVGFYYYATSGVSIGNAWTKHKEFIQQITAEGHKPDRAHTFKDFVELSEREDREINRTTTA